MNNVPETKYLSLVPADHFNIATLGVDSGLFHCVAVQDCGYADCK